MRERAVASTTGAIIKSADGISFDLTKLARVTIGAAALSNPPGLIIYGLHNIGNNWGGDVTLYLPPGVFALADYDGVKPYGTFTIEGTSLTAATGVLVASPSGVTFDLGKLTPVRVPSRMLSNPLGLYSLLVGGAFSAHSNRFFGDPTFYLPDGPYRVHDRSGVRSFGGFTVAGHAVATTSGAVVAAADGISFDLAKLAPVTPPIANLSVPAGLLSARTPESQIFGSSPDPTLYLPTGSYTVLDPTQARTLGGFTVNGTAITAGSGGFALAADGTLAVNRCGLRGVDVALKPSRSTVLTQVSTSFSGGATFWLPASSYSFSDTSSFKLGGDGAVTDLLFPSADPAVVSVSPRACQQPPTTTCVGAPGAPITLAAACSATIDSAGGAGSCSGGGGGLASCTFDGHASRVLASGDHAITVVGTAGDGSTSSCTSYVRVSPCAVPPLVTCVGSSDAPVVRATTAACGLHVTAANGIAGGCADAGSGLTSCKLGGAASQTLAPGAHAIEVVGVSGDGSVSRCTSYLTVRDEEPPSIECASPKTVECAGATTPVVSSATCADDCGTCSTSCTEKTAGVGASTVSCAASDPSGNRATCDATVNVVDTLAPAVAVTVSPTVLWPPEHQLVPITITTHASDGCDAAPSVTCSAHASEAPLSKGSGRTIADIVWSGGQLYLRAERSGPERGRTYTVTCTARDASGNTSTSSAVVAVPHD